MNAVRAVTRGTNPVGTQFIVSVIRQIVKIGHNELCPYGGKVI